MQQQPGFCSLCFTHIASALHFPAHALICAGKKRATREPEEEEIRRMLLEDRVDDVRALLENDAVPRALISIQYARSVEMCRLLLENGADRFEYVGKGQVALEVAARYLNAREFLPRGTSEKVREYVAKLVALRDRHYAEDGNEDVIEFYLGTRNDWDSAHLPERHILLQYKVPYEDWQTEEDTLSFEREMIWNGFFPSFHGYSASVEERYFQRYNTDTLRFWQRHESMSWKYERWRTGTLAVFLKEAIHSPESFPLLVFGQHQLIYKGSSRTRTDMSIFRTPDSKVIAQPTINMLPVTRYAKGMSGGLFYKDAWRNTYCGTFYYMEPESRTFLRFDNALRAADKREAILKLGRYASEDDETFENAVLKHVATHPSIDLNFTPSQIIQFAKVLQSMQQQAVYDWVLPSGLQRMIKAYTNNTLGDVQMDRTFYVADILGLYAYQDVYDQKLCTMARKQGYDVVILERMIGSRQLVTEVLDTRSREESFKNLHFLEV